MPRKPRPTEQKLKLMRVEALRLVDSGVKPLDAAAVVGVSYAAVCAWVRMRKLAELTSPWNQPPNTNPEGVAN